MSFLRAATRALPFCFTRVHLPMELGRRLRELPELADWPSRRPRPHHRDSASSERVSEHPIHSALPERHPPRRPPPTWPGGSAAGQSLPVLRIDRLPRPASCGPLELAVNHFNPESLLLPLQLQRVDPDGATGARGDRQHHPAARPRDAGVTAQCGGHCRCLSAAGTRLLFGRARRRPNPGISLVPAPTAAAVHPRPRRDGGAPSWPRRMPISPGLRVPSSSPRTRLASAVNGIAHAALDRLPGGGDRRHWFRPRTGAGSATSGWTRAALGRSVRESRRNGRRAPRRCVLQRAWIGGSLNRSTRLITVMRPRARRARPGLPAREAPGACGRAPSGGERGKAERHALVQPQE